MLLQTFFSIVELRHMKRVGYLTFHKIVDDSTRRETPAGKTEHGRPRRRRAPRRLPVRPRKASALCYHQLLEILANKEQRS